MSDRCICGQLCFSLDSNPARALRSQQHGEVVSCLAVIRVEIKDIPQALLGGLLVAAFLQKGVAEKHSPGQRIRVIFDHLPYHGSRLFILLATWLQHSMTTEQRGFTSEGARPSVTLFDSATIFS
jgi:hypothetical protein